MSAPQTPAFRTPGKAVNHLLSMPPSFLQPGIQTDAISHTDTTQIAFTSFGYPVHICFPNWRCNPKEFLFFLVCVERFKAWLYLMTFPSTLLLQVNRKPTACTWPHQCQGQRSKKVRGQRRQISGQELLEREGRD